MARNPDRKKAEAWSDKDLKELDTTSHTSA
jgi:hypothetical protein